MKRIIMYLLWSACLLSLSAQGVTKQTDSLSSRIDTLIKYKLPQGSNVAISVFDLTDGKPLYGYQSDKLSRPASTMKLLTTITALSQPQADEPFRTEECTTHYWSSSARYCHSLLLVHPQWYREYGHP